MISRDPMTRGRELSRIQRDLGLSDEDAASTTGLTTEKYLALKRGAGNPTRGTVEKIARALGLAGK